MHLIKEKLEDNDFEIGDVENFISEKDQAFNHGILVMMASKNVISAGNKEMKAGFWDKRIDRQGNPHEIYHEDTRKIFISCIQTLKLLMVCDFDDEATKKINDLLDSLKQKKEDFIKLQEEKWKKLPPHRKQELINRGEGFIQGFLTDNIFKEALTEFQLDIYREIFSELNLLTKRLNFYKAEAFEN